MINAYLDYGIHGGNSWLQDVKLAGLWETMFTHKPFFLDVNHNEQNIAIIYYNHSIQHNTIFPNNQMSEIKWCLDNNIKVFLDDSWEFGDEKNPDWVHVSYVSEDANRRRCLQAYKENGKTKYKII